MNKYSGLFFVLCIGLISILWLTSQKNYTVNAAPQDGTVLKLNCTNGYTVVAHYYEPDTKGILTKLSINVVKGKETTVYDLIPGMSGSGSRFETRDKTLSFWEHQDQFTLTKRNVDITVCTR